MPEGMTYDQRLGDAFAQWAHAQKLPVKTAQKSCFEVQRRPDREVQGRTGGPCQEDGEANATRARDLDAFRTALRTQWGDTYNARMPRNMATLRNPMMMPTSIVQKLDQSGVLRDPAFHLWWDRQVAMMSSDRRLGLAREPGDGVEPENKTEPGRSRRNVREDREALPARKKAG